MIRPWIPVGDTIDTIRRFCHCARMHGRTRVKSAGMQVVEDRFGKPIEQLLRELYDAEGLTQDQIATRIGMDVTTVRRWMDRFGIESRWLGPRTRKAAV